MHIQHNQCTHQCSLQDVKILSDDGHHLSDHLSHENKEVVNTIGISLRLRDDSLGDTISPLDQINEENALSRVGEQPFLTI